MKIYRSLPSGDMSVLCSDRIIARVTTGYENGRSIGEEHSIERMNIRLFNARILTMEQNREIFMGEVWIRGERIVYVGDACAPAWVCEQNALAPVLWDREIDCGGNLLMPGFKNAHTHSGMTLLRSYADDMPLQEWLNHKIFPVEAKMTGEDIYVLTKLAVLEYLTSGITAIGDMYLTPHTIAGACREMGMRCVLIGTLNNYVQSIEMLEECILQYDGTDPLITFIPGIHAEYTCTRKLLEQTAELAHQYRKPVFTHLSETQKEVAECLDRYGMTPPALLEQIGLFAYGGAGHHCIYVTEEDISILARSHVSVVTNPASNLKLASGIAPIAEFIKAGVNVAIGTDGPASNNCLDMFREMFLVTGLAKVKERNAAAVSAEEVLRMAVTGGAAALGLTESDVLAAGKLADLILIDLKQPNMQPLQNIERHLVYSAGKQNVKMTMIHGRILYENGIFYTDEKPETIYEQAAQIQQRILMT